MRVHCQQTSKHFGLTGQNTSPSPVYIRELVDSLCRDGADTPIVRISHSSTCLPNNTPAQVAKTHFYTAKEMAIFYFNLAKVISVAAK